MLIVLENEYFRLTIDDPEGIVRYTRSPLAFPTAAAATDDLRQIVAATRGISRQQYSLLTDVRDAPGRNDEAFESALAGMQHDLFDGFKKRAILVKSAVGRLQVERLARERRTPAGGVFELEEDAIAYLQA